MEIKYLVEEVGVDINRGNPLIGNLNEAIIKYLVGLGVDINNENTKWWNTITFCM